MTLLDSIKRALDHNATPTTGAAAPSRTPHPEQARVPELSGADLMAEQRSGRARLLLDCREDYEWRQIRIPGSLHIPMRQIPERLDEIDRTADIVVVCAHGNRSYSVAGWLLQNGFTAASLAGGVADWQSRGGETEHG